MNLGSPSPLSHGYNPRFQRGLPYFPSLDILDVFFFLLKDTLLHVSYVSQLADYISHFSNVITFPLGISTCMMLCVAKFVIGFLLIKFLDYLVPLLVNLSES